MTSAEPVSPSSSSLDELATTLYTELREMADRLLARQPRETVTATEVVHECYLKLARVDEFQVLPREQFLAFASTLIRNLLVDRRRKEQAAKRGGAGNWSRITLSDVQELVSTSNPDLLALDEALRRLAERDFRQARIVELRYFGGLSDEEVAVVLGISRKTVGKEWGMARAWLRRELSR